MRIYLLLTLLFFSSLGFGQSQWQVFNTSNSTIPENVIRCLAKDAQGNIWVGTDNGLAKFDGNTFTVTDSSNSDLPVNQIRSVAFGPTGDMWVGTLQAGVAVYNGSSWVNYTSQNSALPDDQVRTITFDTAGNAWLGTTGGVVNISGEGWEVYGMFNSPLVSNNINHVFVDGGTVWVGTVNGGLNRKVGSVWTIFTYQNSGLLDNTIYNITNDIFGNIWFATPAQGLGRYDGSGWYFRSISNSNMPTNGLSAIEIVKPTDVKYIGTVNKGMVRWTNGLPFDSFTVNNSPMPDNHVTCLLQYNDSTFYIGTANGGLVKFVDTTQYPFISGINKVAEDGTLLLYPNPANDYLHLPFQATNAISMSITNALGEVVSSTALTGDGVVDVSVLLPGVYFVRLEQGGKCFQARFVKQ